MAAVVRCRRVGGTADNKGSGDPALAGSLESRSAKLRGSMDYAFFERLNDEKARAYLARYLEVGRQETKGMLEDARVEGVEGDFSLDSIVPVFAWLGRRVRVVRAEPDPEPPAWIKQAMEEHHGGFRDFDEDSKPLVLRASFYFGQAFVESLPHLKWAIGRPGRAEVRQPVVTGFPRDADLPALVVAENLLLGAPDASFYERVLTAVWTWRRAAKGRLG